MDLKEYYLKQIARTNKKSYENYVVSRILNKLDDQQIKFVTQQAVSLKGLNRRALTDLYFPQIDYHVEVDEPHHQNQLEADVRRDADIVDATQHFIRRIDVSAGLAAIHEDVDRVVAEILSRIQQKKEVNLFVPWELENEFNPLIYIKKGHIDLADNAAFRLEIDALRCFGLNYRGYQRATASHPIEKDKVIWFPKLYENANWNNSLSNDGMTIREYRKNGEQIYLANTKNYVVFAHAVDSVGFTLYRFKGVFALDIEEAKRQNVGIYRRIATRVTTYALKNEASP